MMSTEKINHVSGANSASVLHHPNLMAQDKILDLTLYAILNAKKSIKIANAYFISTKPLMEALQIALKQQDKSGEVAALGSLGEAYRLQGNYDLAIKYLQTAKSNQNQKQHRRKCCF